MCETWQLGMIPWNEAQNVLCKSSRLLPRRVVTTRVDSSRVADFSCPTPYPLCILRLSPLDFWWLGSIPIIDDSTLCGYIGQPSTILEMCTAPQGKRTANSMRINDRMQNPVFSKTVESKFYYSSELSDAELLRSPTHSASKYRKNQHSSRMKKFTTFSWSETNNKQAGGQVRLLFRMNCPIINLWNKQTDPWGETSFSWKHQEFIVGEKQENYLKKTKYDKIVSSSFLRVSRVSERSWLNQSHKHTFCTVW